MPPLFEKSIKPEEWQVRISISFEFEIRRKIYSTHTSNLFITLASLPFGKADKIHNVSGNKNKKQSVSSSTFRATISSHWQQNPPNKITRDKQHKLLILGHEKGMHAKLKCSMLKVEEERLQRKTLRRTPESMLPSYDSKRFQRENGRRS